MHKPKPTLFEKKLADIRAKHPDLVDLIDEVAGPQDTLARSLVDGEFLPNAREWHKEMDRIESNIGRYPVGFRHYENYHNYMLKYPERSIDDYAHDMNSQITFDEFLLLSKKSFLYEAQNNPEIVYEYGFN